MNSDSQVTDYAAILADLEAKKLALEVAIASLRAALAAGALGVASEVPSGTSSVPKATGEPIPLPRGALLGKSAAEAIKLYLSAARKKQANKEISDALKQGGVESTSKNFDSFINSALFRLKESGELLRFDDGWGLAEWYPEAFRVRVAEKTGNGGKSKAKKTGKTKAKPQKRTSEPKEPKKPGLQEQILNVFRLDEMRVGTADVLAARLGINQKTVNFTLGKLCKKGKLEKTNAGYRLRMAPGEPSAKAS